MNVSLKWFKEQIKEITKSIVENKVEKAVKELENEENNVIIRPYKAVKLINDVLTIITHDNQILTKKGATKDDYDKAIESNSLSELQSIVLDEEAVEEQEKKKQEIKEAKQIIEGIELLKLLNKEFIVTEDNTVYFKGISRSIPLLLVKRLISIVDSYTSDYYFKGKTEKDEIIEIDEEVFEDDEYIALKRFFLWCCLNPRAEVADSLYDFLERNGMKITKQGFFVALRNVVKVKGSDSELVHFITNAYHKVKAVWKKKSKDYFVYENISEKDYFITMVKDKTPINSEFVGNLETLYLSLPEMKENRYTDDWTKTFDIRIGKKVSMDPKDCNWSTKDCGESGLHFSMHTANYVLCGNTTIFTLINPMKIVGIGEVKGRCWEYLPFMITTVDEADEIFNDEDFDFLQLDEQYAIDELKELEEKIKEGFAIEAKKHSINIPPINTIEIENIIASLETIKNEISDRVINI